ncbi:unnamed protein product [Urochloa humidicola]
MLSCRPGRRLPRRGRSGAAVTSPTAAKYGAAGRVFVVAEEDKAWPAEEQRRVAASCGPGVEVRAIGGADHMPMFSRPVELAQLLMEVADNDKCS